MGNKTEGKKWSSVSPINLLAPKFQKKNTPGKPQPLEGAFHTTSYDGFKNFLISKIKC